MDQQTPPRTPVLEGSNADEEIKKHQESLGKKGSSFSRNEVKSVITTSRLDLPTSITASQAITMAQLILFPKTALYGRTISRIIKLLQSANGLDKIIRTIQYTTRLLAHIMLLKNLHTDTTSAAAKGIRRQFGLTRRLLRCFNNIGQLKVTIDLITERKQRIGNDAVGYILDLIEGVGYMGFGVADSLGYLPEAGIIGIPYKNLVDKMAFHFWLYALMASILGGLVKIWRVRQRLGKYRSIFPTVAAKTVPAIEINSEASGEKKNTRNDEEQGLQVHQELPPTPPDSPIPTTQISVNDAALSVVKDLEEQQFNNSLNVAGYGADILFPLAALKVDWFSSLSDGVLGFAGCISSVVGLRKAWKATA